MCMNTPHTTHNSEHTNTSTKIQIHKYIYTNTNTQIQIHKYKCTKTNTTGVGLTNLVMEYVREHTTHHSLALSAIAAHIKHFWPGNFDICQNLMEPVQSLFM